VFNSCLEREEKEKPFWSVVNVEGEKKEREIILSCSTSWKGKKGEKKKKKKKITRHWLRQRKKSNRGGTKEEGELPNITAVVIRRTRKKGKGKKRCSPALTSRNVLPFSRKKRG